jgi:prephenate dehydrogenase
MSEKLQVAIVGLGLIGASAGLALRRYQDRVTVIGHDRDPEVAGRAKKMGAVDRSEWNLISTIASADRILLALPLDELKDTLEAMAGELKSGCVVVDTADVKVPVIAWAKQYLPPDVHFVGGHPIVMSDKPDTDGARADLFDKRLFCLTPDPQANDTAVRLAADIADALGALPYFVDPYEHDGMAAAVEQLPAVLAGAFMSITSGSAGWPDMRKLAGTQFYAGTALTATTGRQVAVAAAANKENVARWLDALIAELGEWRDRVAEDDVDGLAATIDQGLIAGQRWLSAQARGSWDEDELPQQDMPTAGGTFREMFFGRTRQKPEKPKKK